MASTSESSVTISSKSWSLTYNPECKEMLIWKNGTRLKLKDGNSSGRVTAISILNMQDGTVTVSLLYNNKYMCIVLDLYSLARLDCRDRPLPHQDLPNDHARRE